MFRILLSIFFFGLLIFLLFITFFVPQDTDVDSIKIATNLNTEKIPLKIKNNKNSQIIYYEKINLFDNIYSSKDNSYTINKKNWEYIIKLDKKALYIFDFNDLSKKFKVISDWYIIDFLSTWKFYIDNTWDKVLLFSINSTINLKFYDLENKTLFSNIYLYPHQFIKFDPNKNNSLSWADFFRIILVKTNWYFKYKISNFSELEKIIWKDKMYFIKNFYLFYLKEYNKYNETYKKMSDINIWTISWEKYIEKYFSLFINDSKKIIYYKKLLFLALKDIFLSNKNEDENINNIKYYLSKIKKIDIYEYNNMNNLLNYYYKVILYTNTNNNDKLLDNFYKIIENNDNKKYLNSLIYLKNTFHNYDFDNNKKNLNDDLNNFIYQYLNHFDIYLWEKDVKIKNKDNEKLIESINNFIEDYIKIDKYGKSNILWKNIESLWEDIEIFNKHILLNKKIYFSDNNVPKIVTWLYKNLDLLKNVKKFFIENVFKEERDSRWLLHINDNFIFSIWQINKLEKDINILFDLFDKNSNILDKKRDLLKIMLYKKYKKIFSEYFLAIKNYNSYIKKYDKWLDLLEIGQKNNIKNINTKKEILTFLKTFNYLDTSNFKVQEIEWKKGNYHIDWLKVELIDSKLLDGVKQEKKVIKNISFDIDFFNGKTISNIILKDSNNNIDKSYKNYIYNLDNQKEVRDKIILSSLLDNEEKYDFKNFFHNVFSKNINIIKPNNNDKKLTVESQIIWVIKEKLLIEEFSLIRNIFKITYNDIKVKEENGIYYIKIIDAPLRISKNDINNQNYIYNLSLSWEYKLEKNKHYFYNVKVKIHNSFWWRIQSWYWFNWLPINIIGTIKLDNFNNYFYWFINSLDPSNYVYKNLLNNINIKNLWIYYYSSKKLTFKFENNWKSINISLLWDKIISISVWWNEILSKNINYKDIIKVIKNIK